jgi:hypothetical protein
MHIDMCQCIRTANRCFEYEPGPDGTALYGLCIDGTAYDAEKRRCYSLCSEYSYAS